MSTTNTDQEKRTAINTATINFAKSVRNNAISKVIDVIETATTTEPTTKITPTLTVSTANFDLKVDQNTTTITYNGDGNLYLFDFTGTAQATISGATLTVADADGTFKVGATEGTNYAVATPVTVTVVSSDTNTDPTIDPDPPPLVNQLELLDDDETTAEIKDLCHKGLDYEDNSLYHLSENIKAELEGLVDTSNNTFDVVTVRFVQLAEYPVTIAYYPENIVVETGWNYYVIFTTDPTVEDYFLTEAVGQYGGFVTFDLLELLDLPTTMIVMQALP